MNLKERIKNFKVIEEIKIEQIQKLGQNRRGPAGFLFLTQPEDKIKHQNQDKELWNGIDEEYKKMKDELLKERIELGHQPPPLEFRQRYLSSAN